MKTDPNQIRSDPRSVIAKVGEKKLQQSHGIPVKLSPLEDVIDGMMGNARINLGGESIENVFANWNSAKDADDVYNDPSIDSNARPLSKADLQQLDGYIASAKTVAIEYPETVRNLANAIENGELEEALKLADGIGSREAIESIADENDITMSDREYLKLDVPEQVIHRLDELCEDRCLAALNKDLEAVGLKPCSRDSYGEPIKWEPGTKVADLDQSGKGLAETFIDEARANGEIPPAQKKPAAFGKNRTRGGSGRPFSATTANHAMGQLDPDHKSGPFAGSRFAGNVDIDALAANEAKIDRAEQRARQTARLDVEPEKPRSSGLSRE